MISSQPTTFLSEVGPGDHVISVNTLAYLQERAKGRFYDYILRKFAEAEKGGLTRAQLARRIGRSPEVVTRLLGAPGNWTLETAADLLVGIASEEVTPASESLIDRPLRNYKGRADDKRAPLEASTETRASLKEAKMPSADVASASTSSARVTFLVTQ